MVLRFIAMVSAGLALTPAWAWAQASPTPLAQAFEQAWARSPHAAALAPRRAQQQALEQQAAAATPGAASLTLGTQRGMSGPESSSQEFELELATPVWLPGQRASAQGLGRASARVFEARTAWQRLELAGEVRQAWWRVQRAALDRGRAQQRHAQAAALHADVERRWRAGELAALDEQRAAAERQAAALAEIEAEAEREAAQAAWQQLTGAVAPMPDGDGSALDHEQMREPSAPHPRLALAEAAVARAEAALGLAERSAREAPELALRLVRERGGGGEPWSQRLGVQLKLPFSEGPKWRAEASGARAELAEAQAELERLDGILRQARVQARAALKRAGQRVALAQRRAQFGQVALALQRKAFDLGQASLAELLAVTAEAREARAEQLQAEVSHAAAVSELLQTLGVLP